MRKQLTSSSCSGNKDQKLHMPQMRCPSEQNGCIIYTPNHCFSKFQAHFMKHYSPALRPWKKVCGSENCRFKSKWTLKRHLKRVCRSSTIFSWDLPEIWMFPGKFCLALKKRSAAMATLFLLFHN